MSLMGTLAGILQQQPDAVAFNPLDYGTPSYAFWAADPDWSNPGDGNAVTSWRNDGSASPTTIGEIGSGTSVTYRSAASAMASKPALQITSGGKALEVLRSAMSSVSQPSTLVTAIHVTSTTSGGHIVDSPNATRNLFQHNGTSWVVFAGGTPRTQGTAALNTTYVTAVVYNAASSVLRVNGSNVALAGSPGTDARDGIRIFSNESEGGNATTSGFVAYVGIFPSDITGESWFSTFEGGLRTMYGV